MDGSFPQLRDEDDEILAALEAAQEEKNVPTA